jgi:hypothetical protein
MIPRRQVHSILLQVAALALKQSHLSAILSIADAGKDVKQHLVVEFPVKQIQSIGVCQAACHRIFTYRRLVPSWCTWQLSYTDWRSSPQKHQG